MPIRTAYSLSSRHRVQFFCRWVQGRMDVIIASGKCRRTVGEEEELDEPFKGGGMGPLQIEKVRMLVQEGVEFGKNGKMLVSRDAVWKF